MLRNFVISHFILPYNGRKSKNHVFIPIDLVNPSRFVGRVHTPQYTVCYSLCGVLLEKDFAEMQKTTKPQLEVTCKGCAEKRESIFDATTGFIEIGNNQ